MIFFRKSHAGALLIVGLFAVICLAVAPPGFARQIRDICFGPGSNQRLTFPLFEQAPPPPSDDARHYPYYPLTAASSMNLAQLTASRSTVAKYWFLWANRCYARGRCGWNPKGNVVFPRIVRNGTEVRPFFSSHRSADACTLIQAGYGLGASRDALAVQARAAGLRLGQAGANISPLLSSGGLREVCLLPPRRLPVGASGIVLDYEVQDGRSPQQTAVFLGQFAALVRRAGKQAILFTNPLDAPTQRYTGINASNAHALLQAFDRVGIMLWSRNRQHSIPRSLAAQLALLGWGGPVDRRKLMLVFELRGTTMQDAARVHGLMTRGGFGALMFWRNRAQVGGSCGSYTNRKIACAAFGNCG